MARIFLLAGAPAVGKSTTARALAARFPKSIHIPVDVLRTMVVSGQVHPGSEWGADLVEQLALARTSAAHMAMAYSQAGFAVVIDDFWDPNSSLLEYGLLFDAPDARRILLYPSQQAAEERNRKRSGPGDDGAYIAGGIRVVYEQLRADVGNLRDQGWAVVDTTDQSVEATVDHLLAHYG
jgi:predicted kinase